jgi:lysophospholipase L1-like esterase
VLLDTLEGSSAMSIHSSRFRLAIALFIAVLLTFGVFLSLDLLKKPAVIAHTNGASLPVTGPALVALNQAALSTLKLSALNGPAIRIMPLGDSITAGVGSSTRGGYRIQLLQDCMAAHWHVQFVGSQINGPLSLPYREHEGHPGWRIRQISAHVVNWLQTYKPQVVLLQIGTNDINYHDSVSSAPDRLRSLLVQITSTLPGTIVIVAQVTPLRNTVLNAQVLAYNRTIPSIVQSLDAQDIPVHSVDMYHAVPVTSLPDGIHPNDTGYAAMANVWYQALYTLLKH